MRKGIKVCLIILLVLLRLAIIAPLIYNGVVIFAISGFFDTKEPREIAVFTSPDGDCTLTFYQIGDPEFPFGATHVRLVLTNRNGETCDTLNADIHDDGCNAGEHSVRSVEWTEDGVRVTLCGSEMEDTVYTLSGGIID